jgi:hypothetical protein
VGAGIFSTIGKASSDGGPAVIFLFLFTALACSFAALLMPSLRQWFLSKCIYVFLCCLWGTDCLDYWLGINHGICNWEYHGAISWSDYFTGLLESGGIHLPQWVQMDYLTASLDIEMQLP